jgi:peptidoglycan/LPS O-acetylase OafA/YrhL
VIWLALSCSAGVSVFGRRADLSYGVYLYGWPVAQLLVYFSHQTLQPLPLFALTMAITFIFAYASWRIVEAPSLAIVSSGRAAAVAA